MSLRAFLCLFVLLLTLSLSSCGGGNDPVNKDKDRPKKDG